MVTITKEKFTDAYNIASQQVTGHEASASTIDDAYKRLLENGERAHAPDAVPVFTGKVSPRDANEPEMMIALNHGRQLDPTRGYYRPRGNPEHTPII
jgi:hypothetical protein